MCGKRLSNEISNKMKSKQWQVGPERVTRRQHGDGRRNHRPLQEEHRMAREYNTSKATKETKGNENSESPLHITNKDHRQ